MKLSRMVCPNCGASIQVDTDKKHITCKYCGSSIGIDDGVKHIQYDNAEQAGYEFEKGRQRAQEERNAINYVYSKTQQPKRKTWLWVLGWICIFPLPLTILMVRSQRIKKPVKIAVIAVAWIIYLLIAIGGSGNTNETGDSNIVSTNMEATSENSNIIGFKFSRDEIEVIEGKSTSSGYVTVDVRDKNAFSPEDVIFKSGDEDIAVIRYEKDALTNFLYFVIDGIKPGETYVYVTSKDGLVESEHIKLIVKDDGLIDPESISLQADVTELALGGSANINVIVSPEGAIAKKVQWASSDESILTVNEKGVVTAVGGGTATVTAAISDSIKASCEFVVDGTRRSMHVHVKRPRENDFNIGDEWAYYDEIDGEKATNVKNVSVGDTIRFYSKYTESDDNPDVGEASTTHTVTEEDLKNGFTVPMDLYVTENGGRNSGKSVHFIVTYFFSVD